MNELKAMATIVVVLIVVFSTIVIVSLLMFNSFNRAGQTDEWRVGERIRTMLRGVIWECGTFVRQAVFVGIVGICVGLYLVALLCNWLLGGVNHSVPPPDETWERNAELAERNRCL